MGDDGDDSHGSWRQRGGGVLLRRQARGRGARRDRGGCLGVPLPQGLRHETCPPVEKFFLASPGGTRRPSRAQVGKGRCFVSHFFTSGAEVHNLVGLWSGASHVFGCTAFVPGGSW